jgi:hypothetical protein
MDTPLAAAGVAAAARLGRPTVHSVPPCPRDSALPDASAPREHRRAPEPACPAGPLKPRSSAPALKRPSPRKCSSREDRRAPEPALSAAPLEPRSSVPALQRPSPRECSSREDRRAREAALSAAPLEPRSSVPALQRPSPRECSSRKDRRAPEPAWRAAPLEPRSSVHARQCPSRRECEPALCAAGLHLSGGFPGDTLQVPAEQGALQQRMGPRATRQRAGSGLARATAVSWMWAFARRRDRCWTRRLCLAGVPLLKAQPSACRQRSMAWSVRAAERLATGACVPWQCPDYPSAPPAGPLLCLGCGRSPVAANGVGCVGFAWCVLLQRVYRRASGERPLVAGQGGGAGRAAGFTLPLTCLKRPCRGCVKVTPAAVMLGIAGGSGWLIAGACVPWQRLVHPSAPPAGPSAPSQGVYCGAGRAVAGSTRPLAAALHGLERACR